jgi:hypothetical protein
LVGQFNLYIRQTPVVLDAELDRFVTKIFSMPDLMVGTRETARRLYHMYSAGEAACSESIGESRMRQYVSSVSKVASEFRDLAKPYLQGEVPLPPSERLELPTLSDCAHNWLTSDQELFRQRAHDFIYFPLQPGKSACRVYANVKWTAMPTVLEAVGKHVRGLPDHGICSFKIAGAGTVGRRIDAMVLYCASDKTAFDVSNMLGRLPPQCFDRPVPRLTRPVCSGISLGANPTDLLTGFAPTTEREERQSFGTLRTQAIAAAIYFFKLHAEPPKNLIVHFKHYVGAAFRACGLDPHLPGSPPIK